MTVDRSTCSPKNTSSGPNDDDAGDAAVVDKEMAVARKASRVVRDVAEDYRIAFPALVPANQDQRSRLVVTPRHAGRLLECFPSLLPLCVIGARQIIS